ncbi:hypothetical protein [Clostridioides difficile]|uniref:hypothetical protein n=1 Tax=Clostridioides difficile TaxID=1496 RepID=UPI000871F048|nr:hypothetical protein [Clostridioides difficile]AXU49872.1 tail fiber protein [Clostridioides difficile]MBS4864408.1 hypothetical protein [Clostridioides difficile]MCU6001428.1 hypothetical protein [Clostridioides difficile]MCU6075828.1 hypothetical protein [Clostridioides difficile]MCV2267440.1 hypothetical protein [Clostridioides difficile]
MTEKLTDNASLEELMTALQSVQNDFQTGKNNLASALGSPFLSTDKLSTTKTKIETLKNTFATNLTNKNVSASKTESIQNLINKILNITPLFFATGECTFLRESTCKKYADDRTSIVYYFQFDLNFHPKFIVMYSSSSKNYENTYFCTYVPFISTTKEERVAYALDKKDKNVQVKNGTCVLPAFTGSYAMKFYAVG